MHDDVDDAKPIAHRFGESHAALLGRDVCGDELRATRKIVRCGPRRGEHGRALFTQAGGDGMANTLARAGDEGAQALQFAIGHQRISRETILSPAILKMCRSVMGLPGKSPTTLPTTTTSP